MDSKRVRLQRLAAVLLLVLGMTVACEEVPLEKALADSVQNIAILPLEDKTGQGVVEQMLNEKVTQAFISNARLKVTSKEDADVIMQWTLQRYDRIVLTFDANQVPIQYRLQIIMDVDLTDAKSGKLLLTTRRTVDLTPEPTSTPDAVTDWDSTEIRSLKEFTTYYTLNNLGKRPEDEYSAQQRVTDQMTQRMLRLIVTGSFGVNQTGGSGRHHGHRHQASQSAPGT